MIDHSFPGGPAAAPARRLSELAGRYDVILSDVWGVVHNGVTHTPAAADALMRYRAGGGTVILITNAPRPSEPIKEMLDSFGLPRAAYDDVVSSGDVTVDMIAARGQASLHHIGPQYDLPIFEAVALRTGAKPKLAPVDAADYIVCTGLFNDRDEPNVYMPRLKALARRGLPMICANPDIVVHIGEELLWCAGAMAERYAKLGGEVIMAGKPYPAIYEAAFAKARAIRGEAIDLARVLAIGDGFYTDMNGAKGQGMDGLFISTGIHRDTLHRGDDLEIDADAYARMMAETGITPNCHSPHLVW